MKTFIVHASVQRTMMIPLDIVSGHAVQGFVCEATAPTVEGEHFEAIRTSQKEYLIMRVDEEAKRFAFSHFEIDRISAQDGGGSLITFHPTFDYGWKEMTSTPAQAVRDEYSEGRRWKDIFR